MYDLQTRVQEMKIQSEYKAALSLGPHCVYFRMRKLKSQVAKVSTVWP